jgi:Fe2+ or Zn2+ uptake regulation protein
MKTPRQLIEALHEAEQKVTRLRELVLEAVLAEAEQKHQARERAGRYIQDVQGVVSVRED